MHSSFESFVLDCRYGFRGLRRHPDFAITAVLAAALGIGASTAVFSAVDRILFRALPYHDEDRLMSVGVMAPLDSNEFLLPDAYFILRRNPGPFEQLTSFQAGAAACDLTEQNPIRLHCLYDDGKLSGNAWSSTGGRTNIQLPGRRPKRPPCGDDFLRHLA